MLIILYSMHMISVWKPPLFTDTNNASAVGFTPVFYPAELFSSGKHYFTVTPIF